MENRHPIAECRDRLNLSQGALGVMLGVDAVTVSRWECGRSVPRRGLWPKLEDLGVPIDRVIAAARPVAAE